MSTSQPVIVLVHGAWADATSWNSVLSELQDRGFTVYAPPNPLRGLPQDSAYMHQYLTQNAALQGQPVVLVAHSYGGAVITNAAVDAPEVRALVYVDAFIPDQGDRVIPPAELTFMAKRAGAPHHRRRRRAPVPHLRGVGRDPRHPRGRPGHRLTRSH
jgi:pimeloyl-ACP methyl ester carboxylesterase